MAPWQLICGHALGWFGSDKNSVNTVLDQITSQQASQNYSVVMLTPAEFSLANGETNSSMIDQLRSLLTALQAGGKRRQGHAHLVRESHWTWDFRNPSGHPSICVLYYG